ncbi:hypothetical protein AB0H77_25770 [Streptomyces sp. NPDC050844]|uniref:hypothetical protein n=1 Tax=Streptomyces sp. NPDC050844 TaxID=3155790 RepID=UPI0033E88E0D
MYALVTLVPFVLLATVMGLSWWEDRILPPADPAGPPVTAAASSAPPHAANPALLKGR